MSREFFCQKFRLKVWSLFLVVVMLGLALGFTFKPVRAAGLELSTPYPGITVVPGERVSFPLDIRYSGSGRQVEVAVIDKPEGWETTLEGMGKTVHQVYQCRGFFTLFRFLCRLPGAPGGFGPGV